VRAAIVAAVVGSGEGGEGGPRLLLLGGALVLVDLGLLQVVEQRLRARLQEG